MTFSMSVKLENVDQTGISYKGTISIHDLYKGLSIPVIHYCPVIEKDGLNEVVDQLYSISNRNIPFCENKVNEMAVLFLQNKLYWSDVIWNVRKLHEGDSIAYQIDERILMIYNTITIPDSKHRHKAYYQLIQWKLGMVPIPDKILDLEKAEITRLVENFNEHSKVSVIVHNLYPEDEILMSKQINLAAPTLLKPIGLFNNEDLTIQFLLKLMERSTIFSNKEVELNRITVHKKSRKLVPKSILETTFKPIIANVNLIDFESFISFIDDFFTELSKVYKEIKPTASAEERHHSRRESLIINNIMFSPLVQIAYEVWSIYHANQLSWKNDTYFSKLVEGLTKSITLKDRNGQLHNVNIMSKQNIHWNGKVVNDQQQIINNRISQRIAYEYLSDECKLEIIKKEIVRLA